MTSFLSINFKFIVSFAIYSWTAFKYFFNYSKPIRNQSVNPRLVLQKKNFLRMCDITKSWPCIIHAMNSKVSTSLSPLSCKFAISFCRIHVHTDNAAPGRCVLDVFLLQFLSHPRDHLARPVSVIPHPKFPGDFRVDYRMNRCSGLCLLILRLMLEGPEVCLMLISWQHGAYFSAGSFAPCPFPT